MTENVKQMLIKSLLILYCATLSQHKKVLRCTKMSVMQCFARQRVQYTDKGSVLILNTFKGELLDLDNVKKKKEKKRYLLKMFKFCICSTVKLLMFALFQN